jgi:hypothetical protein
MKSTTSTAVTLTLIMFIIVIVAGSFLWLSREREIEQADYANQMTRVYTTIEAQDGVIERIDRSLADALEDADTTATFVAAELENRDQLMSDTNQSLAATITRMNDDLASATAEMSSRGPLLDLISPAIEQALPAGEPVELIIVASDQAGLNRICLFIEGEIEQHCEEQDGRLIGTFPYFWTPQTAGTAVGITISADSSLGGKASNELFTFNIIEASTSTPTPTIAPTPEVEEPAEPAQSPSASETPSS